MQIAMNQPYLFPYRGYFDLIASCDKFVIYDDAKYEKSSWVNRNKFPELFTFQLEKHSDYARINECYFKDLYGDIARFRRKFPNLPTKYFKVMRSNYNLSYNISLTLIEICKDLGIHTNFCFASEIPHRTFADGVVDVVRALGGDSYINLPGGRKLYTQKMFGDIKLKFIDTVVKPSILCEL